METESITERKRGVHDRAPAVLSTDGHARVQCVCSNGGSMYIDPQQRRDFTLLTGARELSVEHPERKVARAGVFPSLARPQDEPLAGPFPFHPKAEAHVDHLDVLKHVERGEVAARVCGGG